MITGVLISLIVIMSSADTGMLVPEEYVNLRDPFQQPDITLQKGEAKSELESFDVDQFKVLGVVTGLKQNRAMILAPNGKTYFVLKNQKLGSGGGKITKISPNEVQVAEVRKNLLGQTETTVRRLTLPLLSRGDIVIDKHESVDQGAYQSPNGPGRLAEDGLLDEEREALEAERAKRRVQRKRTPPSPANGKR